MGLNLMQPIMAAFIVAASVVGTFACEITLRDAAFRTRRDMHRLCVLANADDAAADAIAEQLTKWLDGPGKELNVELIRVNADDPNVKWTDYGIPSSPPSLPVVVLAGRNNGTRETFYIQHWEGGPAPEDLEVLKNSPARENLLRELGGRLAVILYVPGSDPDENAGARVVEEVRLKWSNAKPLDVAVVRIDREDEREWNLLSFMGVPPEGPEWAGVVFGRGKLMSPPMKDTEITAEALNKLIDQLALDCSCSKPLPSVGIDLPLQWNEGLDDNVVYIGDPAELPKEAELKELLTGLGRGTGKGLQKTVEENSEATAEPSAAVETNGPPVGQATAAGGGGSLVRNMILALSVLVFVVIAISAAMWWRKRASLSGRS